MWTEEGKKRALGNVCLAFQGKSGRGKGPLTFTRTLSAIFFHPGLLSWVGWVENAIFFSFFAIKEKPEMGETVL